MKSTSEELETFNLKFEKTSSLNEIEKKKPNYQNHQIDYFIQQKVFNYFLFCSLK